MTLSDTVRYIDRVDDPAQPFENVERFSTLCQAHPFSFNGPETVGEADLFLPNALARFSENRFDVPELHVYRGQEVTLSGQYALISREHVVTTDLRPLPAAGPPHQIVGSSAKLKTRSDWTYLVDPDERGRDHIETPVFLFASRGDRMHHHWLFDVLSKLHVWETVFDRQIKLAVPNTLSGYKKQAYADLGLTDDQMVVFDVHRNTTFNDLYFAPCLSQSEWLYAPALKTVRERLFEAYDVDYAEDPPTRNIFLSRRDMLNDERVLLNEIELAVIADRQGLELATGSMLNFAEQVRYFARVGTCAIVHGSAGGNVLFGNHRMNAIHLHPSCVGNFRAHGRINAALEHRYSYLLGAAFFRRERFHANPWYVDPTAFTDHLKRFG